ncbi:hypothetical protein MXB_3188 [Myxobolus squamalis]|nr:hypothetical protein MXB_3188 [Myxobolus squamalis]
MARLGWSLNGEYQGTVSKILGNVPVMVKSKRCSIQSLHAHDLIRHGEEINPLAIVRPSWKNKMSGFTEYGVSLRSVDEQNNGVLLVNYSDFHIYSDLLLNNADNSLWMESAKCMMSVMHKMKICKMDDAKRHVSEAFRVKLGLPSWASASHVSEFLLKNCICVHLNSNTDKYNMLIFMAHKLMALVDNKISPESTDTLNNQEILLPGQIYQIILRDKMEGWLNALQYRIQSIFKVDSSSKILTLAHLNTAMGRCPDIGLQMEYFVKSGNVVSRSGLGLSQITGFSIVADKLNYIRYLSHFRSVHRGAYFSKSYSTKVRKLLPECWGFMCPVHTPDGSPCGLLTHLAQSCEIVSKEIRIELYLNTIFSAGVIPCVPGANLSDKIVIQVDGKIVGYIASNNAEKLVHQLKDVKVKNLHNIEIIFAPKTKATPLYPGIFVFSNPSRLIRPVFNLESKTIEYVGPFEQIYLYIAISDKDVKPKTTHKEIDPCFILSITASLTPFSDCNQSPRNMYQCQMMKQSMGVALMAHRYRFDNKLYRLLSIQTPICRSLTYENIQLDNYPIGLNAVLAVISYTGYDMEDAMILNKATIERGFASGCMYKSVLVDLIEEAGNSKDRILIFGCKNTDKCFYENLLDLDGLPPVGRFVSPEETFYKDMPFTENGIIPDIIFNPHGFPSRMTIGMMIETMASKVGALNGEFFDCSPFKSEDISLVDFFGQKLSDAGYNYYGSERLYSGTNGEELEVNIFTGIVYYQRLRHMVSDKFQVRNSGPVDALTHQPVGGRIRGGGVRFGEMERDALISHGCAFLLQDRLFDCSDKSLAFVCEKCGDILATKLNPDRSFNPLVNFKPPSENDSCNISNPTKYDSLAINQL